MINFLKLIFVSILAAGMALLWDDLCTRWGVKEPIRVGGLVPLGEEIIKFALAVGCSLPLIGIYALFGLWEGIYEAVRDGRKNIIKHLSVTPLTHVLFGVAYFLPCPLWIRFLGAVLCHVVWNQCILKINCRLRG